MRVARFVLVGGWRGASGMGWCEDGWRVGGALGVVVCPVDLVWTVREAGVD